MADRSGFSCGDHFEPSRRMSWTSSHVLLVDGCNRVSIHVASEPARDRTYLAVTLPEEELLREVCLADGRRIDSVAANVEMTCEAVLLEDGADPEAWRNLPVHGQHHRPANRADRCAGGERQRVEHRRVERTLPDLTADQRPQEALLVGGGATEQRSHCGGTGRRRPRADQSGDPFQLGVDLGEGQRRLVRAGR